MTAATPLFTDIRGRRVPLTAAGVLPAFCCHFCGRRHRDAAMAIDCSREQGVLPAGASFDDQLTEARRIVQERLLTH